MCGDGVAVQMWVRRGGCLGCGRLMWRYDIDSTGDEASGWVERISYEEDEEFAYLECVCALEC